jgi:hypothetical protein
MTVLMSTCTWTICTYTNLYFTLDMKISVFWVVARSGLLDTYCLTLNKKAVLSLKTSVSLYQSTRRNVAEHLSTYHHRCDKLKCSNTWHISLKSTSLSTDNERGSVVKKLMFGFNLWSSVFVTVHNYRCISIHVIIWNTCFFLRWKLVLILVLWIIYAVFLMNVRGTGFERCVCGHTGSLIKCIPINYYYYYYYYYYYLFLTAIGLTPGGSSTVHIYTQTVHRIQRTEHT